MVREERERPMTGRKLKKLIREVLTHDDLERGVQQILVFRKNSVVGPLISFFCSKDPLVKGKAISVLGVVAGQMADREPESGRVLMRRLMWSLNDESGGIGWGAPEAMGEIMARSELLAVEFHKILSSYVTTGANFLDIPALQKGALWGIMRLASAYPERLSYLLPDLRRFFNDGDKAIRAFAAKSCLLIDPSKSDHIPETLSMDSSPFDVYWDGEIQTYSISTFLKTSLKLEDRVKPPVSG